MRVVVNGAVRVGHYSSEPFNSTGVNISTEKRKLFPDNLLKTRNFSQGNCDLLKGTSINEVTFGVFLNPFPSPPL